MENCLMSIPIQSGRCWECEKEFDRTFSDGYGYYCNVCWWIFNVEAHPRMTNAEIDSAFKSH